MSASHTDLAYVQQEVADRLESMKRFFKPGVRFTLLIRTPQHPDRDFLMTDDLINEAITALLRRKHEAQRREAGIPT